VKLYQEARTGKIKWLDISTEGAVLRSQWGLMDSEKVQEVEKVCTTTNPGKLNERTPEEQAVFEAEAKIVLKRKEGYKDWDELQAELESEEVPVTLDELPDAFCPCKPISKAPQKVLDDPNTYGQKKHNGHCIIMVRTESGTSRIFSRRMEDITGVVGEIPLAEHFLAALPLGSMVLCEFTWEDAITKVESPRKVAELVRVKDSSKALDRFIENSKTGRYRIHPFDALWWKGAFIGSLLHMERHNKLTAAGLHMPHIYQDWRCMEATAREEDWEGFVLRTTDDRSCISYSIDGKAHREGSYKYKFIKEDDVVLVSATMGKSGKHAEVYARFDVRQYNSKGELVHYGHCGTGVLKHDELKAMTKKLDNGEMTWPLVAELEYQSRQEDSHKFEFPIIQRIRTDKTPEECVFNP
jgi:hypothetical protein